MKKLISYSLSALMILASACQKTSMTNKEAEGYLSLGGMVLDIDDAVDTKASPASNYYVVTIVGADGQTYLNTTYKEIKDNDYRVTLPAGEYTLEASSEEEFPEVGWENPIYSAAKDFTITAGEVTELGEITCTLSQCKVTVDYAPEFLACVTGTGKTSVSLIPGFSLDYEMGADARYEKRSGFFMVGDNTSMTVNFQGSVDGKNKKMSKVFTGIAPRQWRQIKFVQKVNEQGDATFDIVINPLVSDATLNNAVTSQGESVLGEDPDAPKGDGGIIIYPDYDGGCDPQITDLSNMLIVPESERKMAIILKAECPNGIRKFDVNISTDNSSFAAAVAAADATNLNLISPSAQNAVIFEVVPFPHGEELIGETVVPFDLSNAQGAILNYKGHHKFTMTIVDQQGCKKSIEVIMVVE